ncbi:MAG: tryptophan synthase subunit alpha [Candidatus Thermoplasmatota archaeon]|nr:tryptophan synthase subunit alpha [Candidatus Thermoplasmatota archaeon]
MGILKKNELIIYLMAGDTNLSKTLEYVLALERAGADIIELGIPFSDPIADGATIQLADLRAFESGTTPEKVLELVKTIRKESDIPIAIMTYYNIIFNFGEEQFVKRASAVGVDGIIVPDLPIEESDALIKAARAYDIATIFLASPASSNERIKKIIEKTKGFLYLVSVYGVTGAREELSKAAKSLIKRVKLLAEAKIPVALGFGISKPKHVYEAVKAGASAVIVGSAVVKIIEESASTKRIESFVKSLKNALSDA